MPPAPDYQCSSANRRMGVRREIPKVHATAGGMYPRKISGRCLVTLRPEQLRLQKSTEACNSPGKGTLLRYSYLGRESRYRVRLEGEGSHPAQELVVSHPGPPCFANGESVKVTLSNQVLRTASDLPQLNVVPPAENSL